MTLRFGPFEWIPKYTNVSWQLNGFLKGRNAPHLSAGIIKFEQCHENVDNFEEKNITDILWYVESVDLPLILGSNPIITNQKVLVEMYIC